jgi:hypothetical protein
MTPRLAQLQQTLTESNAYLNRVLDAVGDGWDTQIYSDGAAWTARQLLIHLALSNQGLNNQVFGIAEGREVIPPDFDINRYNKRSVEKKAEMTNDEARASLNESRAALFKWMESVDDSVLEREGRHASLKVMSLAAMLQLIADHERGHANDIARVLAIAV